MVMEKLPPHDIDAEESVIGSLLIDGDAVRQIEHTISPGDFYHEISQWLFQACIELRSRREAINQITVAQELSRQKKLESCGGAAFLSHLISACPTSLDIKYYADIVRRLSVSRQLIALGGQIAGVGYNANPDPNKSMEEATVMLADLKKTVTIFDELVQPKDAGNVILDMITEYNNPQHSMSWGFNDLDNLTSGIHPELVIFGARPSTGKTQIMLDVLESLAKRNYRALFCSAEMSIKALMERKIARELKTDIRILRKSGLPIDLMDKMMELAGVVSERQVYYLPQGISSFDIYNEATKLKETIGLDIVFVDYLQILKDCWQVGRENKTVLVGRASKVLKSLVEDLQIPVICASQLSRDIERRPEDARKPVLADLRECLAEGTNCLLSNGNNLPIEEIKPGSELVTLGQSFSLAFGRVKEVWRAGVQDIYKIKTQSGRIIEASNNHRFLVHKGSTTDRGWEQLKNIQVNWKIATPNKYPEMGENTIDPDNALLLGLLIGDGYLGKYAIELTMPTLEECEYIKGIADRLWGVNCRIRKYKNANAYRLAFSMGYMAGATKNKFTLWLRELGILGKTGSDKEVPAIIFNQGKENISRFLCGLFHADATVSRRTWGCFRFKYDTISERLARQTQHLLLRVGIPASVREDKITNSGYRTYRTKIYSVNFANHEHIIDFARDIGFLCDKHKRFMELLHKQEWVTAKRIRRGYIKWERIQSIEYVGQKQTYDIEMVGSPYFCANEFLTHNSGDIEQDADVVFLLWRDLNNEDENIRQTLEVKMAKNRQLGDAPFIRLNWLSGQHRYVDAYKGE